MNSIMNHPDLIAHHEKLATHSLYTNIKTIDDLKLFMETHIFAVWDFMSLLKRLQKDITCVEIPWRPSPYPKKMVRLINEIVLGEESDLDQAGEPIDHFSLYINAMKELGANPSRLLNLTTDLNFNKWCSPAEASFVKFNLNLASSGKIHEVAAAFFFGREKIIPDMFTSILSDLDKNFIGADSTKFPHLRYYLERHIEIDGGEHSHLAHECLVALCGDDEMKWLEAKSAGVKSLILRSALWDEVEYHLCQKNIT
jgi:hypothetical protein